MLLSVCVQVIVLPSSLKFNKHNHLYIKHGLGCSFLFWYLECRWHQHRNESLFNLVFPIRPVWSLLVIVPETAGGVLNSENEIRWPTGKNYIGPAAVLVVAIQNFQIFWNNVCQIFSQEDILFFHQIFIDRFSHKITFSSFAVYILTY